MKNQKGNINFERKAEKTLEILDLQVDVPDNLIEETIKKGNSETIKNHVTFDFSKYIQIAAVFAAAIFIGVIMGKNAVSGSVNSKHNKEKRALMELREKHHLLEKNSFGHF